MHIYIDCLTYLLLLLFTGPPATALGFDPPDPSNMKRPPRGRQLDIICLYRYVYICIYIYIDCFTYFPLLLFTGPPATALGLNPPDLSNMKCLPHGRHDPLVIIYIYRYLCTYRFIYTLAVLHIFFFFFSQGLLLRHSGLTRPTPAT